MTIEQILIPGRQTSLVLGAVARLESNLAHVHQRIDGAIGPAPAPNDLAVLLTRLANLREALSNAASSPNDVELPAHFADALRTALSFARREAHAQITNQRRTTQHPELLRKLDERMEPYRDLASRAWYRCAKVGRIPRAADYLTSEYLSRHSSASTAQPIEYDPKHGILRSAAQLWRDFGPLREACDQQLVGLSVVFVDIDDFKSYNSDFGEVRVDRDVLPPWMRALNSAVFGHGTAYRYGGDEFVLLFPNAGAAMLRPMLESVRSELSKAKLQEIDRRPQLSMGVKECLPDYSLTEDEILERASGAKRFAKTQPGKNATGWEVGEPDSEPVFSLEPTAPAARSAAVANRT